MARRGCRGLSGEGGKEVVKGEKGKGWQEGEGMARMAEGERKKFRG